MRDDRQAATVELLRALAGLGIAKDVIVATPENRRVRRPGLGHCSRHT